MSNYRNPWSAQHVNRERAFADNEAEMGPAYDEAQRAEEKPTMTCGSCGAEAFFKPTVGRHVCQCGAVHVGGDTGWTTPTYPKPRKDFKLPPFGHDYIR